MPSYQLPVNTPLKSKLVWKRSWWGEGKRFVWSIQLFIDSLFFPFFFLVLWPFVMYYSFSWTLVTKDFQVSLWKARGFFSKMKVLTCALTLISWLPCERLLQRGGSNLRSNFRVQCFTKFYFQSKLLSYFNIMPIFLSLVILSSRDLKTHIPHEWKQGIQILVLISIAQVPSLNQDMVDTSPFLWLYISFWIS